MENQPIRIIQSDKTPAVSLEEDLDFHCHPMTMTRSPFLKDLIVAVTKSAVEEKLFVLGSRNH